MGRRVHKLTLTPSCANRIHTGLLSWSYLSSYSSCIIVLNIYSECWNKFSILSKVSKETRVPSYWLKWIGERANNCIYHFESIYCIWLLFNSDAYESIVLYSQNIARGIKVEKRNELLEIYRAQFWQRDGCWMKFWGMSGQRLMCCGSCSPFIFKPHYCLLKLPVQWSRQLDRDNFSDNPTLGLNALQKRRSPRKFVLEHGLNLQWFCLKAFF